MSEYLEGGLARPERLAYSEHLLSCRECHILLDDVKGVLELCRDLRSGTREHVDRRGISPAPIAWLPPVTTERDDSPGIRIMNGSTVGEMLSCQSLDLLIGDYYEGLDQVLSARLFSEHFSICGDCRRLIDGVRQALDESNASAANSGESSDYPQELFSRILAATVGASR